MSIPYRGEELTVTQPDGAPLRVRVFGDQHFAIFETLDGYTVVRSPATGHWHYAMLSADGRDLIPTGAIAGEVAPASLGLAPGLRLPCAAARAKALACEKLPGGGCRWRKRRARHTRERLARMSPASGVSAAPPKRTTTGDYLGLCVLVEFPDEPRRIPREEVEAFCNQPGYVGFGNHGSVYDYFLDNSGGKLRYRCLVTEYYMAKQPRSYYADVDVECPERARELIEEALGALAARGFDFSRLTVDDDRCVYAVNVLYAGQRAGEWMRGLWPHASHLAAPFELAPGVRAHDYQITEIGDELTLGTFCHENGHMICEFPDLYDYGNESSGVGAYCLMSMGGIPDPKNPTNISAYLKYRAGWADRVTRVGPTAALRAGANDFFIHARDQTEYFIIENRAQRGRDAALPDAGLAIWHVDEKASNNDEQGTAEQHYECALVQADGRRDLEHECPYLGDADDLFGAPNATRFGPDTTPSSAWWSGAPSGLDILEISGPASHVMLRVGA